MLKTKLFSNMKNVQVYPYLVRLITTLFVKESYLSCRKKKQNYKIEIIYVYAINIWF